MSKNIRKRILDQASNSVLGQREHDHGKPEDTFTSIAKLWSVYLEHEVNATDVTICMALLKIGRLMHNPGHEDSWADLAGYAACGADVSIKTISHQFVQQIADEVDEAVDEYFDEEYFSL